MGRGEPGQVLLLLFGGRRRTSAVYELAVGCFQENGDAHRLSNHAHGGSGESLLLSNPGVCKKRTRSQCEAGARRERRSPVSDLVFVVQQFSPKEVIYHLSLVVMLNRPGEGRRKTSSVTSRRVKLVDTGRVKTPHRTLTSPRARPTTT